MQILKSNVVAALIWAAILFVLLGDSTSAFAQSGGSQSVSIGAADAGFINQVTSQLNSLESSLQSAFSSMSGTLSANGKELEWALFSVMFVWTGVMGMLKGETLGEVFAAIIMHTLMLGIVMMCLNSSSQNALVRTFSTIASQFNSDGANLAAGFKGFFTAISSLWTDGGASSSSSTSNGSGGWFSSLFHTIGDFDLGSMLAALAIVILKVITTVVIAGASAIWAANYILSQAKLFIGMAVAHIGMHTETQLVDIERQCSVLVVHIQPDYVDPLAHHRSLLLVGDGFVPSASWRRFSETAVTRSGRCAAFSTQAGTRSSCCCGAVA